MTLRIADVSEFQKAIDWQTYGANSSGVIVRIHNSNRPDYYSKQNIWGARKYVAWRGWYQYLTAGADPVKAAHDFQAELGPTLPGEVMILDLEEGQGDQSARRAAWINALQDPVEWTYSGMFFAREHLPGVQIEWLAAYGQAEPKDSHKMWQYTNAQKFPGIMSVCDASTYNGTLAQLQALSKTPIKNTSKPTPPPPSAVVYSTLSVRQMQQTLRVSPTDSKWGKGTDDAAGNFRNAAMGNLDVINIKLVQHCVGVKEDGVYGKITTAAVYSTCHYIQQILKVSIDGSWGINTDRAYQSFRNRFFMHF